MMELSSSRCHEVVGNMTINSPSVIEIGTGSPHNPTSDADSPKLYTRCNYPYMTRKCSRSRAEMNPSGCFRWLSVIIGVIGRQSRMSPKEWRRPRRQVGVLEVKAV